MGNLALWIERRYHVRRVRKNSATERALTQLARRMQSDMQAHHPWRNQTGNAEKSVGAVVDPVHEQGGLTTFMLRAGYVHPPHVEYGYWLERAHAGRFAIVGPTVEHYKHQIKGLMYDARYRA